jgi:hypothetical protein
MVFLKHLPDADHPAASFLEQLPQSDQQIRWYALRGRPRGTQVGDRDAEAGGELFLGTHEQPGGAGEIESQGWRPVEVTESGVNVTPPMCGFWGVGRPLSRG